MYKYKVGLGITTIYKVGLDMLGRSGNAAVDPCGSHFQDLQAHARLGSSKARPICLGMLWITRICVCQTCGPEMWVKCVESGNFATAFTLSASDKKIHKDRMPSMLETGGNWWKARDSALFFWPAASELAPEVCFQVIGVRLSD